MTENFVVTGMTCSACSAHVEKAVSHVEGVEAVAVNLMTGRMSVTFDEGETSPDAICAAVVADGYGAQLASQTDAHRQQEAQEAQALADAAQKQESNQTHCADTRYPLSLSSAIHSPAYTEVMSKYSSRHKPLSVTSCANSSPR